MTAYILQVIFFHLLFLLVYEFLLKKETFFTYNRLYLLITAVSSFVLPLIKIETLSLLAPAETLTQMSGIFLPEVFIGGEAATEGVEQLPEVVIETSGGGINPWMMIYLTGVLVSFAVLLKKYSALSRMFRFKKIAAEGFVNIIEVPNSRIACTFNRTIFLGDQLAEAEKQHILSHEMVHVKQKHSLDLVFFEILKVIFWFNPLLYIYQSRIATVHEFIADAAVVEVTETRSYYEQLLNSAFNTQNISFLNQFFNHSIIKKRIIMLQRKRSKSVSKVKYLLIVPLLLLMLTYVACTEGKTLVDKTAITEMDDDSLRKMYLEQIKQMEENGASKKEIENTFFISLDKVESREDFYKSHTYLYYLQNKSFERKKAEGTHNEGDENRFNENFDKLTYEEFLAHKSFPPPPPPPAPGDNETDIIEVRDKTFAVGADVPFAIVDKVPVYPGCESLGTNQERKECMSQKVQEFVTRNFNTNMAKELGIKGVNRIVVVFKISEEGNIVDVRANAPHPELELEAKRVIEGLPQNMTPGQNNGQNVRVSYTLPIVFQVSE